MEAEPPARRNDTTKADAEGVATEERPSPLPPGDPSACRVLVTGGEGFLGSHLIPRLLSQGHLVRATYHDPEGPGRRTAPGVDWRRVDVCVEKQTTGLAEECDVVVHLAGLFAATDAMTLARVHGTGTRHMVWEAERAGVARFVYVSVLGARPGDPDYLGTKFDAESAVVSSKTPAVVLRPSVVYGPGDRFVSSILAILRRLPVFPLPGAGRFRLQPLAVEDMVDALSQCVERDDLDGHEFDLAGPEPLSFREIVQIVAELSGLKRPLLPLPAGPMLGMIRFAHRTGLPAPFSSEQLALFATGSVLSSKENPLPGVFRVKPLPFRDALADYLESG